MSIHALPRRRRHFTGAVVAAGATGSLALALSLGASLSGFTASINNDTNTAASGTISITESSTGSTPCTASAASVTCSTINKYGGTATPMVPGGKQTTTITFTNNTGSVAVGTSTMKGGTCTASTRTGVLGATTPTVGTPTATNNLCSQLSLQVYKGTVTAANSIYTGTLAAFQTDAATSLGTLAAGGTQDYNFVVTFVDSANNNAVAGQQVSQPIQFVFNQ